MTLNASLTLGIEEEYLLVDPGTRDLVGDPPSAFMEDCRAQLGERVAARRCTLEVPAGLRGG